MLVVNHWRAAASERTPPAVAPASPLVEKPDYLVSKPAGAGFASGILHPVGEILTSFILSQHFAAIPCAGLGTAQLHC